MPFSRAYSENNRNRHWLFLTTSYTEGAILQAFDTAPAEFGDVLLLAYTAYVRGIATFTAAIGTAAQHLSPAGCNFTLADSAGAVSVPLGTEPFRVFNTNEAYTPIVSLGTPLKELQRPVAWRTQYRFGAETQPMDTNVAPTAQLSVWALVEQIRSRT